MQYGKSALKALLRLPLTRQMLLDMVDSLWRSVHKPVSIDPASADYLSITTEQVLSFHPENLPAQPAATDTADITETPTGDVDGVNTDYTLSQTAVAGTLRLYLNGIRQKRNTDYTFLSGVIAFAVAPFTGDVLIADYKTLVPGSIRVFEETPSGDVDGVNADFVLLHTPVSVYVYLNGVRQQQDVSYTVTGSTITFATAPFENDVILCDYEYELVD